ncbi:MAG: CbtA family protein [Nocardioides sp.]|uniref:CbtA family protein n=1 Tax=Nocardioides sp. TaxID=35761 RepID=UPI0039E52739
MTARNLLIRGLLAGLIAGFATFLVAHQIGEPHVETAIGIEEAHSAEEAPADETAAGHDHGEEDEGTVVTRPTQRTWGLLTGTMAMSLAFGGLVALVSAGVAGRMGQLTLSQSTALVTLIGFVSVALVPFLKYPATPPAVGNPDTISHRTGVFFAYLLISLIAAVVITMLALRLQPQWGTYAVVVGGVAAYVLVVVVAGVAMPTVNEIGDFPADTLWFFRRASLITIATMWSVIGVALVGLLRHLERQTGADDARRELAASL